LGQPNQSLTGKDPWGGHAYRRGIVHYLARSGEQVSRIQSLLRLSSTSRAILKYMGTATLQSDSTLAEKAARRTTIVSVKAEIKEPVLDKLQPQLYKTNKNLHNSAALPTQQRTLLTPTCRQHPQAPS
jgi:cell division protein FtsX